MDVLLLYTGYRNEGIDHNYDIVSDRRTILFLLISGPQRYP